MTADTLSETGALIANRNGRAYNLTMSTDQTLVGKNNLTSRLSLIRIEQGHIIIVDPDSLREISS